MLNTNINGNNKYEILVLSIMINDVQTIKYILNNFTININNTSYTIDSSGFQSSSIYYCVTTINTIMDNNIINFVDDNYYSKSMIFDVVLDQITKQIDDNKHYFYKIHLDMGQINTF